MDYMLLRAQMGLNTERLLALGNHVTPEQAAWKPTPDSWSILEVFNHLLDEERFDFRVRLNIILSESGEDWPPINPQGWVTERQYNTRQLEPSIQVFQTERQASLVWLDNLQNPDWNILCKTPWGAMTAGDMFVSWVKHDLLHLRQLVELHFQWTGQFIHPYNSDYAGEW
jgi:hypothetical protein